MQRNPKRCVPTRTLVAAAVASSLLAGCSGVSAEPTPTVEPTRSVLPTVTRPSLASPAPVAKSTVGSVEAGDGQTYEVKQGDTLGKIAQEVYGDWAEWRRIYDANKDAIGDNPDAITIGMKLKIPPKQ